VFARGYFLIERPKLGLGFSYEFEDDERRGPYINTERRTMTYSERLDIETEGWAYHPGLVIYTLRLSPQWEQRSDEFGIGEETKTRAFLSGYLTELTFLQYKPYTLRIFANRYMSILKSNFAEKSKTESDTYGATLMLKYSVLPTTLSYNHLESIQTGFYPTDKETDEFRLSMRYDKNLGDTRLEASYTDSTETTSGITINTIQQAANLQNYSNLTKDKRVTLGSVLSYRDTQSNFIKTLQYNVYENLLWRHRKNLTTNYSFRYNINKFGGAKSESSALSFNLRHLLYENLTTTVDIDGASNQFTGGRELIYGAGLNFNYMRRIPWGMLNIDMGHDYKITERDITANYIQVIDEPITLRGSEITFLANKNIDIDSIVVRDNTRTIPYIKNTHYKVTEIGSSIGISRIGTTIGDGQEVLVSYKYLSTPAFDYSTFNQSYGINLDLWYVLMIYYRFNRSKQRVISGIPPEELIDDSIHTAGTEFRWKWSRTKLEFEDRETTNMPATRWRAEETITLRPFEKVFFSFSGNYGRSKFKDTGETERSNGIRANIQMLTSRWSRFTAEGFRYKISGLSERTTDSGVSLIFEWFYEIWRGSLSYRFLNEKDEIFQETRKNHYILFEIKRTLF
jgi:hypothetical protein